MFLSKSEWRRKERWEDQGKQGESRIRNNARKVDGDPVSRCRD